eukprot:15115790-Ditylum_brightwellii.AAC.1
MFYRPNCELFGLPCLSWRFFSTYRRFLLAVVLPCDPLTLLLYTGFSYMFTCSCALMARISKTQIGEETANNANEMEMADQDSVV